MEKRIDGPGENTRLGVVFVYPKKIKGGAKELRLGFNVRDYETECLTKDEAIGLAGEIGKRFRHHYYGQVTKVTECPTVDDCEGEIVEKLMVELDGGQMKFLFPVDTVRSFSRPKEDNWILIHFVKGWHAVRLFQTPCDPSPIGFFISDQDLIDIDD